MGSQGVAELAAQEAVRSGRNRDPGSRPCRRLGRSRSTSATSRRGLAVRDSGDELLAGVECEVPVIAGDERIGSALALSVEPQRACRSVEVDREEVLRAAALASLTVLAVTDARDEVAGELRGSLLEDLRARPIDGAEVTRRAARMGCDLSRGAVALVAEVPSARPRHAAVLITGEHPGAFAEPLAAPTATTTALTRIYALLPARDGEDGRRRARSRRRAGSLRGFDRSARRRSRRFARRRRSSIGRSPRRS